MTKGMAKYEIREGPGLVAPGGWERRGVWGVGVRGGRARFQGCIACLEVHSGPANRSADARCAFDCPGGGTSDTDNFMLCSRSFCHIGCFDQTETLCFNTASTHLSSKSGRASASSPSRTAHRATPCGQRQTRGAARPTARQLAACEPADISAKKQGPLLEGKRAQPMLLRPGHAARSLPQGLLPPLRACPSTHCRPPRYACCA